MSQLNTISMPANGYSQPAPVDLDRLALAINQRHLVVGQCIRNYLRTAIEAGGLLLEARKKCQHGQWLPWLETNVDCSRSTAYVYMGLAENRQQIEVAMARDEGLTIDGATELIQQLPVPARVEVSKFPETGTFTATISVQNAPSKYPTTATVKTAVSPEDADWPPKPKIPVSGNLEPVEPLQPQPTATTESGKQILQVKKRRMRVGRGEERITSTQRESAKKLFGKFVRLMDQMKLFADLKPHIKAIEEVLKW